MQMVTMKELTDVAKIENLCAETKEPVFVTKNGSRKLVVMDIETFERLFADAYEVRTVNEGLVDLEKGRVEEGSNTLKNIRKKYGIR